MATTARTGFTLDLRRARHHAAGVGAWATRAAAVADLAVLRECGLNLDRDIEVHRAETHLARFWVIGLPDHYNGVTYLMTDDGQWVCGRLTDTYANAAPWTSLRRELKPATVTHTYGYSAGSVGLSDGRGNVLVSYGFDGRAVERTAWGANAWCIACTWSTYDSTEDAVRNRARWHRNSPEEYADHATPRRRFAPVTVAA